MLLLAISVVVACHVIRWFAVLLVLRAGCFCVKLEAETRRTPHVHSSLQPTLRMYVCMYMYNNIHSGASHPE